MGNEKITVLMVEPEKAPYPKTISSGLESLQREVGGDIQAVYPYEEPVALICNENGKLEGLPLNRALRDEDGHIYDVVAGKFMIAGLGEEDFASLDENLIQKFSEKFRNPELFLNINGRLRVIQTQPPKEERSSIRQKLASMTPKEHTAPKKNKDREAR